MIIKAESHPVSLYIKMTYEDGTELFVPKEYPELVDWLDAGNSILEPGPVPIVKEYSKRGLFNAMTNDEYAVFVSVESQQSPREARVFREAQSLSTADPAFAQVDALMRQAYGDERAEEIFSAAEY